MEGPAVVYWTLNDTGKVLSCKAEGEPTPIIAWTIDNHVNMSIET
jgi:hypothetical protein